MTIQDFFNFHSIKNKFLYIWINSECVRITLKELLTLPDTIFILDGVGTEYKKVNKQIKKVN